MTNLKLENARIIAQSGGTGSGLYEITIQCPLKSVSGEIREVFGLEVEIKKKTE